MNLRIAHKLSAIRRYLNPFDLPKSPRKRALALEPLEPRRLLAFVNGVNPVVTFQTSLGDIDLELLADEAPITVDNFLNYVNDARYVGTVFHRADPRPGQVVVQGGSFRPTSLTTMDPDDFIAIDVDDPIGPEFGRSNIRGTVAMAQNGLGQATSGFFANTADNSNLDLQDFTVFAIPMDMVVFDAIAALDTEVIGPGLTFSDVPYDTGGMLVVIEDIVGDGAIVGTKYNDLNGDGDRDAGEPGIGGVTIFVDDNNNGDLDAGELSTTTAADGSYEIVLPGGETYIVREVAPDGFVQTEPADSHTVDVEIGRKATGFDFGNSVDLPTVTVVATDLNAAEAGLNPGEFTISITDPGNPAPTDLQVFFTVGGTATSGADYDAITATSAVVNVGAGAVIDVIPIDDTDPEGNETVTLTLTPNSQYVIANNTATVTIADDEASSSLSGFVYFDEDNDGMLDDGEFRIGGVEVVLEGPNGFTATERTAGDGSYSFVNLTDGDYTIAEDPSGVVRDFYQDGIDTPGTQDGTADSAQDEITAPLPADTNVTDNLFGEGARLGEFISKRDFLSSTPTELILAAVDSATGAMEWFSFQDGWEGFTDANISISEDMSEVTLTVTNDEGDTQTTIIDATDGRAIQFIGTENGTQLFYINGTPEDFNFTTGNVAPTAANDSYSVDQDDVLAINAADGVLDNDRDANGDTLTASRIDPPDDGDVTLNPDGSFTYTPDPGFNGTDSFTYVASDGTLTSNTARVTITVRSLVDENTFPVTENAARGTVVGQVTSGVPAGDTAIYEIDDPALTNELRLAPDDHLSGDPVAPVLLIEYLDFR